MINAPGARGSALISTLPDIRAGSSSTQALCPSQIIRSNGDASIPGDQEVSDVSLSVDQLWADAANEKRALTPTGNESKIASSFSQIQTNSALTWIFITPGKIYLSNSYLFPPGGIVR